MLWGVISGAAIAAWTKFLLPREWWPIALGVAFGLVNWWLWRTGGVGPRWNQSLRKRFPPKSSAGRNDQ